MVRDPSASSAMPMNSRQTLAIIGSGPSCIYLLKHLLKGVEVFRKRVASIEIFEKRRLAGMGMPYHPETTERFNMANISSEELPELTVSFADWLRFRYKCWGLFQFAARPRPVKRDCFVNRSSCAPRKSRYDASANRAARLVCPGRSPADCFFSDTR